MFPTLAMFSLYLFWGLFHFISFESCALKNSHVVGKSIFCYAYLEAGFLVSGGGINLVYCLYKSN